MGNSYFQFRQFRIEQHRTAMKVTTDSCLFGAWAASQLQKLTLNARPKLKGLDIGTGTGLLALMLVQKNEVILDALEVDGEAAEEARENIAASGWSSLLTVYQKDLKEFERKGFYDFIISNPPFYENELASPSAARSKAHHSTHLGLSELFEKISHLLKEGGWFYLLLPAKRKKEILGLLPSCNLHIHNLVTVKHSPSHQPFRLLLSGTFNIKQETQESELVIRNTQGSYTPEFTDLLKEYYLNI